MKIEEIKETYPIFKFFKKNYMDLKKASTIFLEGKCIYFDVDTPFFILKGKFLEDKENIFLEWLEGKKIKISIEEINLIAKCLKRNVKFIEYNDEKFDFCFLNNDEDIIISFKNNNELTFDKFKKFDEDALNFEEYNLTSSFDEKIPVFEIFLKEDKTLTTQYSKDKILEIPVERIFSRQKQGEIFLRFTEKNEDNVRIVSIKTKGDSLNLEQIFLTI